MPHHTLYLYGCSGNVGIIFLLKAKGNVCSVEQTTCHAFSIELEYEIELKV